MVEHWESCECRRCDQNRIADLRAENERLHDELRQGRDYQTYRFTIQRRDAEIAALRAEIERLRDALHRINSAPNSELGMVRLIAREALEGGDDE